MEIYFDVARDVLVNAGLAVHNPEFDPDVPYSKELLIVAPERICSYDVTRVELDCTNPIKGASDRIIRDGTKDDGTFIVTKSSKSASAVCVVGLETAALSLSASSFIKVTLSNLNGRNALVFIKFFTRTAKGFRGDSLATSRAP
jgi:hypothetical protein